MVHLIKAYVDSEIVFTIAALKLLDISMLVVSQAIFHKVIRLAVFETSYCNGFYLPYLDSIS
jgi:hypothetical protein